MSMLTSCLSAEAVVAFVAEELVRRGVITSWIASDTVERVVTRCGSCRGSKPHASKCTGWRIRFGRPTTTLRFQPVNIEGHDVEVRLECDFNFSSKYPGKKRVWSAAPMCACTVAIELYEPGTDNLLTRQHLDLANLGQAGPVWHLQLGGKPAEGSKPGTLWLKVPRWPVAPTDFILIVELVLFSFFPTVWRGVVPSSPWRDYIKTAEQLVLTHYRDRLATYFDVSSTAASWLAAQENDVAVWNPRPAE
jgi:hypothetical protein